MKWIFLLVSTAALIALGFWYFQDQGSIQITWLGYEVELTVVVGIIVLLFFFFLVIVLTRLLQWFLGMPLRWLSFFRHSQDTQAKHDLLNLLSFYEAEVFTTALHYQGKAAQRLANNSFFIWLSGNVFEKTEKSFEAEQCFMELTKNASTAFLGFKGQIRSAMHRGDFKTAQNLLKHAQHLMPTSPWVLRHLLALNREQKNFKEAETLTLCLEDLGYFSSDQRKKQMASLRYLQAIQPHTSPDQKEVLLRQAHSLDPSFAEATEALTLLLEKHGHVTYALTALEATWAVNPQQVLGDLYLKLCALQDDLGAYQVAQNLVRNDPDNPESRVFLARTALKAQLWGEARAHLTKFLKLKESPTANVYLLLAHLELEEKHDWKTAIKWLEKGLQAPRHI